MYLPTNRLLEKIMRAFINFDGKNIKTIEPSIADVLIKFGIN